MQNYKKKKSYEDPKLICCVIVIYDFYKALRVLVKGTHHH